MLLRNSEVARPKSFQDYLLQPFFLGATFILSYTIIRLWLAIFILLPTYLFVKSLSVAPNVVRNVPWLFRQRDRRQLMETSDVYRHGEKLSSLQKLDGTFRFQRSRLHTPQRQAIQKEARWFPNVEHFEVCGARVNVVHEKPENGFPKGKTVVLLHGNPSWSYMWRDVSIHSPTSWTYRMTLL